MIDHIEAKTKINYSDYSELRKKYQNGITPDGVEYLKFNNKGLNISVYGQRFNHFDDYELNIRGSLTYYHHSNNYTLLTRKQLKDSLLNLSEDLSFDISQMRVANYEWGLPLELNKSISSSLEGFGEMTNKNGSKRMNKTPYGNGVTYQNNSKTKALKLYDKVKQMRHGKMYQRVSPELSKKNILRIELKHFKTPTNTHLGDFLNEKNQEKNISQLLNYYHSINRKCMYESIPYSDVKPKEMHLIGLYETLILLDNETRNKALNRLYEVAKCHKNKNYRNRSKNEIDKVIRLLETNQQPNKDINEIDYILKENIEDFRKN